MIILDAKQGSKVGMLIAARFNPEIRLSRRPPFARVAIWKANGLPFHRSGSVIHYAGINAPQAFRVRKNLG